MKKYIIQDTIHCEYIWEYDNLTSALEILKNLSKLWWDKDKNKASCSSWETCGREYEFIEYEISWDKWEELNREAIFDISNSGIVFHKNSYIDLNY